ncbi:MAG TPA: rhodanese-like domain-containing protein, partial [Candidatus Limnocylindria bacterium]|nr:rhodanese-like domain-containing protein [Candidatus Limnocylindria bacterium]
DAAIEQFRAQALGGLGRYPTYYSLMAGMNRRGPRVLGRLILPDGLDPERFEAAVARGAAIVDARDREAFAARHVEGALNIELDGTFAGYVGWLVPFGTPIALVLPETPGALEEATTELLRIGYERVSGWLEGGVEAWAASGRATGSYATTTMRDLGAEHLAGTTEGILLDVRQPIEWEQDGVVPGAERIFVADLPARLAELPPGERVTVFCKSGSRAAIAASLLDRAGVDVRVVTKGGAARWPQPLEQLR